jgi:hypothetical protein
MQSLKEGQFVRHANYGLGVVTQSDVERTSIDFHLHGHKKFVTKLMTIDLSDEGPPPKTRATKARKAAAAKTAAAAAATATPEK